MIKTIKRSLTSLLFASLLIAPAAVPVTVHAQTDIERGLCAGANLNPTDETCDPSADDSATQTFNNILEVVINIFSLIVGVVSVIMIIIGGLKYITSGGDSANVTGAKNSILYAVVGLVVVALAQLIVRFVLNKVTSVS